MCAVMGLAFGPYVQVTMEVIIDICNWTMTSHIYISSSLHIQCCFVTHLFFLPSLYDLRDECLNFFLQVMVSFFVILNPVYLAFSAIIIVVLFITTWATVRFIIVWTIYLADISSIWSSDTPKNHQKIKEGVITHQFHQPASD